MSVARAKKRGLAATRTRGLSHVYLGTLSELELVVRRGGCGCDGEGTGLTIIPLAGGVLDG